MSDSKASGAMLLHISRACLLISVFEQQIDMSKQVCAQVDDVKSRVFDFVVTMDAEAKALPNYSSAKPAKTHVRSFCAALLLLFISFLSR